VALLVIAILHSMTDAEFFTGLDIAMCGVAGGGKPCS